MQAYTVASGIIIDNQQVLLVQNRRRNGTLDWSTPGGVVDPGEQVLQALQREVIEETAVVVDAWSSPLYSVDVEFVGREMSLHAQVFRATGFQGALLVDDPDQVVVDGRWVGLGHAHALLESSPRWVFEPLGRAIEASLEGQAVPVTPPQWRYRVTGRGADFHVELVESGT